MLYLTPYYLLDWGILVGQKNPIVAIRTTRDEFGRAADLCFYVGIGTNRLSVTSDAPFPPPPGGSPRPSGRR